MKALILLISITILFSQQAKQEFVLPADKRIIKKGQNSYLPNTSIWVFEGDLIIEKGARLTIQPGTTLKFKANTDVGKTGKDKNRAEVIVLGELIAEGEASSNRFITFTSDANEGTQRSGDWYGIYIYKNRTNENTKLKNCNINFAYRGITCVGSSPYIRSNQILYSFNSGIYLTSKSQATIESNMIQNNGYAGIEVRNLSEPKIYENNISSNEYGIMVYDSSNPNLGFTRNGNKRLKRSDDKYLHGENSISDNYVYDIYNASSKDIYAQNNSWSFTRVNDIEKKIYDRSDQSSYGRVIFQPVINISTAQLQRQNLEDQTIAIASNTKKKSTRNTKRVTRKASPPPKKRVTSSKKVVAKPVTSTIAANTNTNTTANVAKKEEVTKVADTAPKKAVITLTEQSMNEPFIENLLDQGTGQKLNDERPAYTDQIRTQNLKGRVIVLIKIGLDGNVISAQVLKSPHIMLEAPSLEAARKLKFSKGYIQKQAVQFQKTIVFKF